MTYEDGRCRHGVFGAECPLCAMLAMNPDNSLARGVESKAVASLREKRPRDGYTRAREIEAQAGALVAWCDEFVGDVRDNLGNSLKSSGEWDEVLRDLRDALKKDHL